MDFDRRFASMEELVSPSCQSPLLLVEARASRPLRDSERDAALSETRFICVVVVALSAKVISDAFCWPTAMAVAAVPTNAASDAEAMNAERRPATRAASRMARRLIGATSFSFSATAGSRPTTAPSPFANWTIRTALAVWEPRLEVNNALATLKRSFETLAALCAACLIYQHSLRITSTTAGL